MSLLIDLVIIVLFIYYVCRASLETVYGTILIVIGLTMSLAGYVLGLAIQIYKSHYMYKHQRKRTEFLKYLPITRSSSRK